MRIIKRPASILQATTYKLYFFSFALALSSSASADALTRLLKRESASASRFLGESNSTSLPASRSCREQAEGYSEFGKISAMVEDKEERATGRTYHDSVIVHDRAKAMGNGDECAVNELGSDGCLYLGVQDEVDLQMQNWCGEVEQTRLVSAQSGDAIREKGSKQRRSDRWQRRELSALISKLKFVREAKGYLQLRRECTACFSGLAPVQVRRVVSVLGLEK